MHSGWSLRLNMYSCGRNLLFIFTPFKKELCLVVCCYSSIWLFIETYNWRFYNLMCQVVHSLHKTFKVIIHFYCWNFIHGNSEKNQMPFRMNLSDVPSG